MRIFLEWWKILYFCFWITSVLSTTAPLLTLFEDRSREIEVWHNLGRTSTQVLNGVVDFWSAHSFFKTRFSPRVLAIDAHNRPSSFIKTSSVGNFMRVGSNLATIPIGKFAWATRPHMSVVESGTTCVLPPTSSGSHGDLSLQNDFGSWKYSTTQYDDSIPT